MSPLDILRKSFPYKTGGNYKLWYYYRFNRDNAVTLLKQSNYSPSLVNLVNFLSQVAVKHIYPGKLFSEKVSHRVTSLVSEKQHKNKVAPSRFRDFVIEGLSKEGKTRHNKVLIPILQHDPKSLAIEIPVWSESYMLHPEMGEVIKKWGQHIKLTGHIDLLQYDIQSGKILLWDYKPDKGTLIVGSQVTFYKYLLMQLVLGLSLDDIVCGWFDEELERILV